MRAAAALTATAYSASRFFQSTPDVGRARLRVGGLCLFSHSASFRRSHAYSRGSLSRKAFNVVFGVCRTALTHLVRQARRFSMYVVESQVPLSRAALGSGLDF